MMCKTENGNVIRKMGNIMYRSDMSIFKHAFTIVTAALFCFTLLFAYQTQAQGTSKGQTQQNSCQQTPCSSATKGCIMATGTCIPDKGKHKGERVTCFKQLAAHSDMDASCLHERSEKGCLDLTPVSCVGSYGGLGWRPDGAGGNDEPRNHYGSDLGSGACKNKDGSYPEIYVYAAAEGKIVYKNTATGGGRTIAMTHTKGCSNPASGGQYYKTTYRHLLAYAADINEGDTVPKHKILGLVGGSNAKCIGCQPCDAVAQRTDQYKQYWTTAGCGKPYAVHMHYEIEDGPASSSGTAASATTALDPGCDSLQTICGGCPSAPGDKSCRGKQNGWSDGTSGTVDASFDPGSATGGDPNAASSNCTYEPYLDPSTCVFCSLFKTMFNTASQVALMADKGLLEPTANIVKVGFLIWLAVYLLKMLASFNATNSGELAKGILFQGFRVAVVVIILSNIGTLFHIMDLTLNPVMKTGLTFVQNLAPDTSDTPSCSKDADYMQGIMGYTAKDGYSGESATGGLSTEVGEAIICNIKKMEDATGILMTLGKYSCCLSFEYSWAFKLLPDFRYLTTGIFLWLAGLAILLTFPWCLVDCVLQLCIAAAMVPCAIGAYAFKVTSKYLKIIWDFFMNAMFNFVFMALVVYIINQQLGSWIGVNINSEPPDDTIFIKFNGLAWYGMGFIRVAAVCFFCYVFFDEAKAMAEKFASSPGLGGGKGIGRMVGGTAVSAGTAAFKGSMRAVGKGAGALGSGVNWAVGNQFRSARNHLIGYAATKLGRNSSFTTGEVDGKRSIVGHEGSFRLFGRDITFSAAKGEDGKWSLTREVHKRSKTDKAFEKVLDEDGNEVKDENGNTLYRARHRLFGITRDKVDMVAHQDEDGNLVYESVDGKSRFTMNKDGQISSYKTQFTRSYLGLGKAVEKKDIKQYGVNRTINTATSRTREKTDTHGNVTSSEIEMQDFNFFNRDLVRKDGTINIDTFNEMQKSIGDPKRAAQALIAQVMAKRGLKLDNDYAERTVDIDENGVVSIHQTQKDKDGKIINTQDIKAVMVGDQMFIASQSTDSVGNVVLNESNGIFRTVQTATKNKKGKYTYNFEGGFSEYTLSKNKYQAPVNYLGQWGNNINRDKALAGFSQAHYDKYMAKLQLKQMGRTMSTGAFNESERAGRLQGMLHAENLNSADEAMNNMTYNLTNPEQPLYNDLPEDLRTDVKNNLDEVQEIHEELNKENANRESLEKELRELKEKENKSDEEEERIKREIEENQKKLEELKKKQENIDRLIAEIRANEFDVNQYKSLGEGHENEMYRVHQKLDAAGKVIVEVNDFGKGNIERHVYKYDSAGNRIEDIVS